MNSTPALAKLAVYGVRANWRAGSSPIGGSTISSTRPEGWTRVLSYRNARRSPLPADPSVASETMTCQSGPRLARSRLRATGLRRDSWTATTSNRGITSARQAMACQSRLGESLGPASHLAVRSPRARMVQVPTRRLDSVLAGMTAARAARSRPRSSVTAAGGCSVMAPCKQTGGGKQTGAPGPVPQSLGRGYSCRPR